MTNASLSNEIIPLTYRTIASLLGTGVVPLYTALVEEPEDHIKSAAAWALGQIGRHSPDHAKALADAGVLPKLVYTLVVPESSDDLKTKCKRSLKFIVEKLTCMKSLDKLLQVYALSPLPRLVPPAGDITSQPRNKCSCEGSVGICFLSFAYRLGPSYWDLFIRSFRVLPQARCALCTAPHY